MNEVENLWTAERTSEFLGISPGTLTDWRYRGLGPPFLKIGKRVRYDPADVRRWTEAQRVGSRPS